MSMATRRFAWAIGGLGAAAGFIFLVSLPFLLSGCETLDTAAEIGANVAVQTGTLKPAEANLLKTSVTAMSRSFKEITPEQEHYIGRAVGATLLGQYRPYYEPRLTAYLNLVGQTLAQSSDLPETYDGYHFMVLDTDEINAFAAPGGLIFVSRGLLKCCRNEESLAAVLAHEIGHVELRHGLMAIQNARLTEALTTIGMETAKTYGGEQLASLTRNFEGSISDIVKTLVVNGYSQGQEFEADQAALVILGRVGYPPAGLLDMLGEMKSRLKPGRLDFAKTHPSPEARMVEVQKQVGRPGPVRSHPARQVRFDEAMKSV
jgi:predicted Zn-dependent protease